MVRPKNYSYSELMEKFETIKSMMVIVEDTNEISERIMFGNLQGKAIGLDDKHYAYINENKETEAGDIINKIYEFDKFVYENFSIKTFEEYFSNYLKEILLGEPITRKSIKTKFLSKFSENVVHITHSKQVFGLNIASCNFDPFSIGGFDFYCLPSGIKELQQKYQISNSTIEEIKSFEDGEWIFKTIDGYDEEKIKQIIEADMNLFVSALQFTANEFRDTNVNLLNNFQFNHINSFTFMNFKLIKNQWRLSNEVYSKRNLRDNDKKEYFKLWKIFEKHPEKRTEIEKCILRAINWVAKSSVEPLVETGIIECFIALETLFDGKQEKGEITNLLKNLANKCLDKNKYVFNIANVIADYYDNRSNIAHGHDVKYSDRRKSSMIMMAKDIIIFLINNYENLSIKDSKGLLNWVNNNKS